jgi:transcription elongation factor Elf1
MLYDQTLPCYFCDKKPVLVKASVDSRVETETKYLKYVCKKCGISTFGTREEVFCRELWNAGVQLAFKKNEHRRS